MAYFCIMEIWFRDLGHMPYGEAWDLQERLLAEGLRIKSEGRTQGVTDPFSLPTSHFLLFVEHPPVYTLGKSGDISHVLISEEEREQKGIDFFHTNRGGDITFHGPGQIVGYPILDLEKFGTDIGKYLRNLEEVIIRVMANYGLMGERSPGETGVWLDPYEKGRERKICAMGVRCSRWITMHGFAFNVRTDLRYFDHIVPCGIAGKQVASLEHELGYAPDMDEVKDLIIREFGNVFSVTMREQDPSPSV